MTTEKRFSFSREKSERDKREGIRRAINTLQEQYPEILGMSLFGSLTKAENDKLAHDIDGYVYLDADAVAEKEEEKLDTLVAYSNINKGKFLKGGVYNPVFRKEIAEKYEAVIRNELLKNDPALEPHEVKHVWVFPISEAGDMLRGLFHMRVGQGIQKYRKMIIDKLGSLGQPGEDAWQRLIHTVAFFEEDSRVPGTETRIERKHYPQTIQDARRIYG